MDIVEICCRSRFKELAGVGVFEVVDVLV